MTSRNLTRAQLPMSCVSLSFHAGGLYIYIYIYMKYMKS